MTVRWVIGTWGEACGPRPSGGGDAGGVVTIEEQGRELGIRSSERTYSTVGCWDENPALQRQSHSVEGRTWKTTCRTPPTDPRQQVLHTTVTATDEVISFQESGQYQFVIGGQTCAASSGRWRTYRRLPTGAQPVPLPAESPSVPVERTPTPVERRAPEADRCATPGAPARIEVRPARKLMRAGESFQFRASVRDARGCVLRSAVGWRLEPEGGDARLIDGRLEVAPTARDAELAVVAAVAEQAVRARVDVVSAERYASLLASGDFDAEGASAEAASATVTGGSLGARQGPVSADPPARKWTFVAVVSAIAASLTLLGLALLGRARARAATNAPSGGADPGTVIFSAPADAEARGRPRAAQATGTEAEPPPETARPRTVCPLCGALYEARDLRACPKDGAQLLPINA